MSEQRIVRVDGLELLADGHRSMRVKCEGAPDDTAVWLPKSEVEETDLCDVGDVGYVRLPYWLVEDRGLDAAVSDGDDGEGGDVSDDGDADEPLPPGARSDDGPPF